jgi:predicted CXXCH cytochrome family protein
MRRAPLLLAASLVACATGVSRRPSPPPRAPWAVYPDAEVQEAKNAHDYKGAPLCQRCHASPDGKLRTPEPAICHECHPGTTMTHVGKIQKPPPPTLPYEAGGRIICHTCHDPHDVKSHKFGFRKDYVPLCHECHKGH